MIAKLREELDELEAEFEARAVAPDDRDVQARLREELGDVLFVAANLARHARLDPGDALRGANRKFEARFRQMEALAARQGRVLEALDLAEQEALWHQVKAME